MLYIVATPIGNLEDITLRAVRILKEANYVFAEDTRVAKKLLNHLDIKNTIYRYDAHSKGHQIDNVLSLLKEGKTVALTTDAGTPCISDPGFELVDAALKAGIKVVPIPGVSAMTAAASVAGITARRIAFEGFLPKKKGRQTLLKELAKEERTIIIFESPHRIEKTLGDIEEFMGVKYVVVIREITKMYEEIIRGTTTEVRERLAANPIKGEIVLLIKGRDEEEEGDKKSKNKYSQFSKAHREDEDDEEEYEDSDYDDFEEDELEDENEDAEDYVVEDEEEEIEER